MNQTFNSTLRGARFIVKLISQKNGSPCEARIHFSGLQSQCVTIYAYGEFKTLRCADQVDNTRKTFLHDMAGS